METKIRVGNRIQGKMALLGVSKGQTRTGSSMVSGLVKLENGESGRFVSFDSTTVTVVGDLTNLVVDAIVDVQEYNGQPSLKLQDVTSIYDESELKNFLDGYDMKPILTEFNTLCKHLLSKKALHWFNLIVKSQGANLVNAMAAQYGGYHDGKRGGLLNHVRKLLRYAEIACDELGDTLSPAERDIFVLGLLVHDLGKIIELQDGAYSKRAIVEHTYWGIEIIKPFEKEFNDIFVVADDEYPFDELIAVIQQHHGEFGARPKSVYSYLVHVVDLLDSRVSGLKEKLEKDGSEANYNLVFDDYHLQHRRYAYKEQ